MAVTDFGALVRPVLAKQHLAVQPPGSGDVVSVTDDLIGLHGTAATTPYLSLHARLGGFVSADLDEELYVRRTLVRLKAMRGTVFVQSLRVAAIAFAATRAVTLDRDRRWLHLDPAAYAGTAPAVLDAVRGRSRSVRELRRQLNCEVDLSAVVALLCDEGLLVRDRPVGSRRSSAFRYWRWDETYPDVDLAGHAEIDATRLLVRDYVARYGPVSMADIVWWTGLPAPRVRDAVASSVDEIATVAVPPVHAELLMLRDGGTAVTERRREAAVTNLLPELDPFTMGYRDRTRFLDPTHHDLVVDRGGNVTSVVLVDGRVAGVWDFTERPTPGARVLLFDPDHPRRGRILDRAAEAGEFWFGRAVPVHEYAAMVPLTQRSGVMRRPLDGADPVPASRRYFRGIGAGRRG